MQLVLSNNRIIAHGENFLFLGGVVINTETGAKYENATIAECEGGCPTDINEVGYEYHAGVFVPCAPFGKGNNNGYFMEVCTTCATPRNSGISIPDTMDKIESSIKRELIWANAAPDSSFAAQTITLASADFAYLLIEARGGSARYVSQSGGTSQYRTVSLPNFITILPLNEGELSATAWCDNLSLLIFARRKITEINGKSVTFGSGYSASNSLVTSDTACIPLNIYGVGL